VQVLAARFGCVAAAHKAAQAAWYCVFGAEAWRELPDSGVMWCVCEKSYFCAYCVYLKFDVVGLQ
jgi:hypothetical protein